MLKSLHNLVLKSFQSMQEKSSQAFSFDILSSDSHLEHIFALTDKHQPSLSPMRKKDNAEQRFGHIMVDQKELYRDYDSDAAAQVKGKNKKIKKNKDFNVFKQEKNKIKVNKFYVESLQHRVQQLQVEVARLKNLNKLSIEYIKKFNDSQIMVNGFFQHRRKIIQKLEKLANCERPDQRKIQSQCSSLKMRAGCFGQERIKAIKYYFKQMIQMIVSNAHKYLAETSLKNTDLFKPDSIDTWQDWRKDLFLQLNLSSQTLALFTTKREEMIQLQGKFNKKLLQMYTNKCDLLNISRQIERIYQRIKTTLTPLQTGRMLCFLDKYRFESTFYPQDSVRKMYEELQNQQLFSYQTQQS